jgi:sulfite exporter TauE/SafE/copper chaperone CopZ
MATRLTWKVAGMHCAGCEGIVEDAVRAVPGVREVSADHVAGQVSVVVLGTPESAIREAIGRAGYSCGETALARGVSSAVRSVLRLLLGGVGLLAILAGAVWFADEMRVASLHEDLSLGLLFATGFLTGFHCIGMCGGFVLGYTAHNALSGRRGGWMSHFSYGLGKTLSYTLLGATFGALGAVVAFTPQLRGMAAVIAGIFLILFGMNLLRLFPRLRLPVPGLAALRRGVAVRLSRHSSPFSIGFLNGFMLACGPLQAMYVMAAGTGSALEGATRLFVFGLGTLPLPIGFGLFASLVSANLARRLVKVSGVLVVALGVVMLDRGLILTGSGYDAASLKARLLVAVKPLISRVGDSEVRSGYQIIRMVVDRNGYTPNTFVLRKDVPVRWVIEGRELTPCNRGIVVPRLNLEFGLVPGEQVIEFTPLEAGLIPWSCWMGMIPGTFVVEDPETRPAER